MDVPEIDVAATVERLANGAVLVDVREPEEYAEAHIAAASLIPLGSLVERVDEVPSGVEVLVICRSGGRSHKASEYLLTQGREAVNVAGGMLAWIEAGQPVSSDGPATGVEA